MKLGGGPDWYLDDFGFDLVVDDPYPYVPRLAISLNAYGRNPWRGPTLVHYSHPLAPYLVDRSDIVATELQFHADAQDEFYSTYGGTKGAHHAGAHPKRYREHRPVRRRKLQLVLLVA